MILVVPSLLQRMRYRDGSGTDVCWCTVYGSRHHDRLQELQERRLWHFDPAQQAYHRLLKEHQPECLAGVDFRSEEEPLAFWHGQCADRLRVVSSFVGTN